MNGLRRPPLEEMTTRELRAHLGYLYARRDDLERFVDESRTKPELVARKIAAWTQELRTLALDIAEAESVARERGLVT